MDRSESMSGVKVTVPKVEFGVSRVVNEFCHISVLYSELMPVELATGILKNRDYQARNAHLRRDGIRLELQKAGPFSSESEWYRFATGLMRRTKSGGFESLASSRCLERANSLKRSRRFGSTHCMVLRRSGERPGLVLKSTGRSSSPNGLR